MNLNTNYLSIIGAQRSGTTFLFNILDQHPKIKMFKPVKPEPRLFLTDKGLDRKKFIECFTLFDGTKISYLGEKCTSYIEKPEVAVNIKNVFPRAKILVILRNPIDRAISNYNFSIQHKLENRTLNEVFIEYLPEPSYKNISVNPFDYVNRGFYSKYLEPYKDTFGDNLKVIIFEQLLCEPIENDIFDFLNLEVPRDFKIEKDKKINQTNILSTSDDKIIREHLSAIYRDEQTKLSELLKIDLSKYWNI